ncbi:SDR family NAD(P)-dependent oxidoreductase [Paenibacillus sp. FSL L8-0470]|uniref:SDR family NAD(P)-dependent oxidoreductase n=1 Tax=unclassified Paenibacillus TaxID=185978 RepID=UPI0030FA7BE4
MKAYGHIDILVNNAGVSDPTPFMEQAVERWEKTMGINVTSIFLGQNAVIPHMIAPAEAAQVHTLPVKVPYVC